MKKSRGVDKTLLASLAIGLLLVTLSGYLHPYFRRPDIPPVAEWHMINVNGGGLAGDANLLLIDDVVIMIDGGLRAGANRAVVPYLRDLGIGRVNHFIVSNPDPAFYEGLGSVIESGMVVDNLYYLPADMAASAAGEYNPDLLGRYAAYLDFAAADGVQLHPITDDFHLTLPNNTSLSLVARGRDDPATMTGSPGDASILLRFELPRSSVLFSGNPGAELAAELASNPNLESVFLKAPHPDTADIPGAFFDTVNPELMLVPGAKRRWCGETGRTAREWSIQHEIPTWVTGTNGHIRVIWQTRQVMILPQTQNEICKSREFGNLIW